MKFFSFCTSFWFGYLFVCNTTLQVGELKTYFLQLSGLSGLMLQVPRKDKGIKASAAELKERIETLFSLRQCGKEMTSLYSHCKLSVIED